MGTESPPSSDEDAMDMAPKLFSFDRVGKAMSLEGGVRGGEACLLLLGVGVASLRLRCSGGEVCLLLLGVGVASLRLRSGGEVSMAASTNCWLLEFVRCISEGGGRWVCVLVFAGLRQVRARKKRGRIRALVERGRDERK